MSSYALMYVTGFDLDDLPIEFWFINSVKLRLFWSIFILLNSPGLFSYTPNSFCKAGYKIFFTRELFPEPETPVIVVNVFNGIDTSIFFKLFSLAP